jgi:hypothetical protein
MSISATASQLVPLLGKEGLGVVNNRWSVCKLSSKIVLNAFLLSKEGN